jgi:hypothetical protein
VDAVGAVLLSKMVASVQIVVVVGRGVIVNPCPDFCVDVVGNVPVLVLPHDTTPSAPSYDECQKKLVKHQDGGVCFKASAVVDIAMSGSTSCAVQKRVRET